MSTLNVEPGGIAMLQTRLKSGVDRIGQQRGDLLGVLLHKQIGIELGAEAAARMAPVFTSMTTIAPPAEKGRNCFAR